MGEPFTIQISANLVNQLAGNEDKMKKKTKKPKPKVQKSPQQFETKVQKSPPTHPETPVAVWPPQPPFFLPVTPAPAQIASAELEAIRSVLHESEKVVERLRKQEENLAQEVSQRAKELHDKEFKLPYQKPMPCLAEKDACLDCYKEHLKDPLKCAQAVKSFADCARKIRQQVSSES